MDSQPTTTPPIKSVSWSGGNGSRNALGVIIFLVIVVVVVWQFSLNKPDFISPDALRVYNAKKYDTQFSFSYPSNWMVDKVEQKPKESTNGNLILSLHPAALFDDSNMEIRIGTKLTQENIDKYDCPHKFCFQAACYPLIYTDSDDPKIISVFNQVVRSMKDERGNKIIYFPFRGDLRKSKVYSSWVDASGTSMASLAKLGPFIQDDEIPLDNNIEPIYVEKFDDVSSWKGVNATLVNDDPDDPTHSRIKMENKGVPASFFGTILLPLNSVAVTVNYQFTLPYHPLVLESNVFSADRDLEDTVKRLASGDDSMAISYSVAGNYPLSFGLKPIISVMSPSYYLDSLGGKAVFDFVLRSQDNQAGGGAVYVDNLVIYCNRNW